MMNTSDTPRVYEENLGIVLMRTSVGEKGILYEVVEAGGVCHHEYVAFGMTKTHRAGGHAFVTAANRQERKAFDLERRSREERRSWLEETS